MTNRTKNDVLLRVRKQNSFGRPTSQGTHNVAAQRCASLLKNNKNLAISLQETRCELSAYKHFFDESLDFLNKAKLAKSRIEQLSSAFKNFVQALDENLALLEFDESKWLNLKLSPQSRKTTATEIIPIAEVANEVPEEIVIDHEVNCENGGRSQEKSGDDPQTVSSRSPQKQTGNFVKNSGSSPHTENADGHENIRTEAPITPQTDVPKTSDFNSPQHPLPAASVPTQAVKVTKIPALSVTLGKNLVKKSSESQNKACKRKFPEKVAEESDSNISRRKTYVVKDRNVLTVTSYTKIVPDENESRPHSEGTSNLSQDRLISKNDKRQTFVIKPKNVPEETEPAAILNSTFNRELATESRDESSPVQKSILKNRRQTFVKKSPLNQNDVLGVRFSNELCAFVNSDPAPVIAENRVNNRVSENLKSPPSLQINREHSETDPVALKSKSVTAENSKTIEHTASFTSPKSNVRSGSSSSKETPNGSNATKETPENVASSFIPAHIATKVADVVTKRFTFTSYAEVDEDVDKAGETSPKKSRGSFLESSGSDCEVMMIEELVDFSAMKPVMQKTPIRRQITKNKKRRFAFDGKKGKADVEKESQREIINSETAENGSEESSEFRQPDTAGVIHDKEVCEINEEMNEINDANAVPLMPELNTDDFIITDEIVNTDYLILTDETVNKDNLNNIPLDACAVKKKTTKGPQKTKDKQSASTKNNKGKKGGKVQTGAKKKNPSTCVEMDALNRLTKKVKKRNTVKKNEHSYFDDNSISKFEEVNKITTKANKTKAAEKEPKSDFPCEKIGTNTFLVQAEIHPPPPNSSNVKDKHKNKENEKHDLQHMQVAVVLDDILKSKNIELLNISDKNLLCGKTKSPLSASNFAIDFEESIEKFRCDVAPSAEDCNLDTVALIDISHDDLQSEPATDIEIIEVPKRRGKKVNYKEVPLNRKMRRT